MYSLRPKMVDFEKVWLSLRPSVLNIMNMNPINSVDWNNKFSDPKKLYEEVKRCLTDHVQRQYEYISSVQPDFLLQEYFKMWEVYYKGTVYVHMLFGYLNRQFVRQKRKTTDLENFSQFSSFLQPCEVKEVGQLALEIWREELVKKMLDRLVTLLLQAIAEDRQGNIPAISETAAGVITSFVQMEECDLDSSDDTGTRNESGVNRNKYRETVTMFYQKAFEEKFLHSTEEYYSSLAQKMLTELTCSAYMEAVIQLLEKEEKRAKKYLHESSVRKVIELCQEVMIKAHKDKLHAVCHDLITNEESKDLRNMYRLLKPIQSGLSVMVKEFEDYVKQRGLDAVSRLTGDNVPQQFVDNVLKVYHKYNDMKTAVFMDDGEFSSGLDKALQGVVNSKEAGSTVPKASERLSRYTDSLLKKTAKGLTEADLETKLSNSIIIFRYIEDKDIFQKYYSKMLANRLISGSSISMDAEEMMINKLKNACGYEFTSKLSRMFTDIGLSHELSVDFEKHATEKGLGINVSMQVLILQAGSWPLSAPQHSSNNQTVQEAANFILPVPLQPCVQEFEQFYTTKHSGRKLTWLYHMSQADLRLTYLDKQYVITMYLHQMGIAFCFEICDQLTVKEIGDSIGLFGDVLIKTIRTMIDASILIGDSQNLAPESVVSLNKKMTSRRIKFRLQMPQFTKAVEKETETVSNTVSQDRKYYMECAIVRIMKTRKVLKHNALVAEVMDQTRGRFTPDVPFIKKSIEDLIEKMYIQRTDQNDEYQYLA
ncbi:unnamed protein product [Caenorhabditis auriculariae]|uniref:Cullin-2 n=1 Tax=Caenorhabditis auriculariae TaxID=2777116 RepID=A0A8S1H6I4_9PELO|nr:unnamed protein product [Caenorhabditis auriculariae]